MDHAAQTDPNYMSRGDGSEALRLVRAMAARIERLERALRCPRCLGNGSIHTSQGPDECPHCHGGGGRFDNES